MADLAASGGYAAPVLSVTLNADCGRLVIVAFSGELDHSNEQDARREIDRILKQGATCLILDLTRLNFMDSSGINLLVRAYNTLMQRQGTLALVSPSALVYRILQVVQLTPLLPIYPSLQHALIDLAPPPAQTASDPPPTPRVSGVVG